MKTDVVVDVGNSRVKWGRCTAAAVAESVALPPDEAAWQQQLAQWNPVTPWTWVVSGVHPPRRNQLADWLRQQGQTVVLLESARQLPLDVRLEHPDRVGIDRLLNAVAANSRRRPGTAAAVIDAGSAVTVDYIDENGSFRGGAILPGLRLMSQALHDYTALLPLVEIRQASPPLGTNTPEAIRAGVFWAVLGGIEALLRLWHGPAGCPLDIFFTGGDAAVLAPQLTEAALVWPQMTLEGLRLATERLPPQTTA